MVGGVKRMYREEDSSHSMRDNWSRAFVAECSSGRQPVLRTTTRPHPFFNHHGRTPEGRYATLLRLLLDRDVNVQCYYKRQIKFQFQFFKVRNFVLKPTAKD